MVARWMGLDLTSYSNVELPFADTSSIASWALDGMKAMYAEGIIKGSLDSGTLVVRANDSISRAEAMTILGRIQNKGYVRSELTFSDAGDVASWALPYVQSLVGRGSSPATTTSSAPTIPSSGAKWQRCSTACSDLHPGSTHQQSWFCSLKLSNIQTKYQPG